MTTPVVPMPNVSNAKTGGGGGGEGITVGNFFGRHDVEESNSEGIGVQPLPKFACYTVCAKAATAKFAILPKIRVCRGPACSS